LISEHYEINILCVVLAFGVVLVLDVVVAFGAVLVFGVCGFGIWCGFGT
jgi:hypothetical protein